MNVKEKLIRQWALHVDEVGHESHAQHGKPLYKLSDNQRVIWCTAPGCGWTMLATPKGEK